MTDSPDPARRGRGRPRGWADPADANRIKALDRAMALLETLAQTGGATLTDLAQASGQAPASVYRVLVTLEARSIVEFDAGPQLWHVGSGAFRIGTHFLRRTSVVERARPALWRLMEATGETANLGVARDGHVLFLSQVETHESIRAFFPPGTLSPMHASGIGKALLAYMPAAEAARLAARHGLQRFTDNTLTGPEALAEDLARIRGRGYAIDDEEKTAGMRCLAAPIFDLHGEAVAGLSVSGPTARLTDARLQAHAAHVMAAAQSVTDGLGGKTPEPRTG